MKRQFRVLAILFALALVAGTTWAGVTVLASDRLSDDPAQGRLRVISEETGLLASQQRLSPECDYDRGYGVYLCPEAAPPIAPQRDPAAAARARAKLNSVGLLLMPDSTADRVIAFDPVTGDVVDENFIPPDAVNLSTPVNAIVSAAGNTILVSDQIRDVVQEYDLDGNYLGVFAPAGGPDPLILDNIRGIALRSNGNLLVTVGSGANANSVAEFDTAGNYLGNFVAIGSGGLASPFDAYARPADWLVGGITSDIIHRYDLAGAYIANLAPINNFPEQIGGAANGNVLVADFGGTQEGVVELTPDGTLVGIYNPASLGGYRGVYELPNGNILTTTGTGVYEINRSGAIVSTKITGVSGRFIEYVPPAGADLSLEKSSAPAEAAPGDPLVYVIEFRYTDVPTGTATSVVITDLVPIYLTDVAWTSTGPVITPTGSLDYVWEVQDLLPGAEGTITVTGQLTTGLAAGFTFTNTATITSALAEADPGNNTGAATITVLNAPPVAADDQAATPEEQPVVVPVLDNDADPNGDLLHVVAAGTPSHGTAGTDGTTVTYTPTLDFFGTDAWTYTVSDPGGLEAVATVTVTVTPVQDAPIAVDDVATTPEDQPLDIAVLDNDSDPDGDPLSVIDLGTPAHGIATTNGTTVTYTPTLDFFGTDTWTYTIADPGGLTATASVLVTVTAVNDAPIAVDDGAMTAQDQPLDIAVLDNDSDPDGDPLSVIDLGAPAHGTAATDGITVTYTPTLGFAGIDSLLYTIADPGGLTATATVSVTVVATNTPPTISEIADQAIYQDTTMGPVTFTIDDLETAADDLLLSVTSSNLSLVPIDQILFGGSGITRTVTITPTAGMTGTSTITITVGDGTHTASEGFVLTVLETPRVYVYLPLVAKAGP